MPNLKSSSTNEQPNDKNQHQKCEGYNHRTCHNSTDSRDAQSAWIWRRKSRSHTLAIPASRDNFAQENNARVVFSIAGLSARIHFSNSDSRWVSNTEVYSTSRSSACSNRLLARWCSHAQNKCHVISSPDINLQVLMTISRSMQEHAARLTEQNAHKRECIS